MRRLVTISFSILIVASCYAQTAAPPPPEPVKFFRLEFSVKELDGSKSVNSRKYVMTISTTKDFMTGKSSVRSGAKVPVHTGNPGPSQFTYVEVGVNIDCQQAKEVPGGLSLNVTSDVSNTATGPDTNLSAPVIRNNKWSASVIVPLKKSTVIFSSDDPATNHQMQLELLATPIE